MCINGLGSWKHFTDTGIEDEDVVKAMCRVDNEFNIISRYGDLVFENICCDSAPNCKPQIKDVFFKKNYTQGT